MNTEKVPQVVRWVGRVLSVLAGGFVLAFFFGEGGELSLLIDHPEIVWILLPVAGLALAWVWELAGGLIVLMWLPAFYVWNWAESGRFPVGPWFGLVALPSVFFLLAWFLGRARRESTTA